jgi:hypothetical protein
VWSALWSWEAWSEPQLVSSVPYALLKYDLLYDGTNGNLVMSVDTVDNSTNANGNELLRINYQNGKWGELAQLTSDQVPDDNPQTAFDAKGKLVLTWLSDSQVNGVVNFGMSNRQLVLTNDYSSNLGDFALASGIDGAVALL